MRCSKVDPAFAGSGKRKPIWVRFMERVQRRALFCSSRSTSGSVTIVSRADDGSAAAATTSISLTMSCARRSDPTGSAHSMPGSERRWVRIGSTRPTARPSGIRGIATAQLGRAAAAACSTVFEAFDGADRLRVDRRGEVGQRGHAALLVSSASCSSDTAPNWSQPSQVRREIDDRRLEEHPGPRLVHVAERPHHVGVALGRWMVEDGAQVGVRLDVGAREPAPRLESSRRSSAASPRMRASEASSDSVPASVTADCPPGSEGVESASLSMPPARGPLAWARALVSVGSLASTHSLIPPCSAAARKPRRIELGRRHACWRSRLGPSRQRRCRDRAATRRDRQCSESSRAGATVLCWSGYFSRASMMTGAPSPSRLLFEIFF